MISKTSFQFVCATTCYFFGFAIVNLAVPSSSADAQTINDPQVKEIQESIKDIYELYERQLKSVLKTRLEEEEEFVNDVVDLVRQEKLPKVIVDRAWLWVRNHREASRYPFVYFERILRLETEKLEIEIPEFDRSIYSQARRNTVTRKRR